jgi:hypothetical protein
MFWKKISFRSSYNSKSISIFTLKVELSFKTVAQVSYKDEYGNAKIVRFYDKIWIREVLSFTEDPKAIDFKFFAHSPNLKRDEGVILSVHSNNQLVISKEFIVDKNNDFTGWCEFD